RTVGVLCIYLERHSGGRRRIVLQNLFGILARLALEFRVEQVPERVANLRSENIPWLRGCACSPNRLGERIFGGLDLRSVRRFLQGRSILDGVLPHIEIFLDALRKVHENECLWVDLLIGLACLALLLG